MISPTREIEVASTYISKGKTNVKREPALPLPLTVSGSIGYRRMDEQPGYGTFGVCTLDGKWALCMLGLDFRAILGDKRISLGR